MAKTKKLSEIPSMNDDELTVFWEKHEPEAFSDWEEGGLDFKRPPKKLIQLRLDPRDVRVIDRILSASQEWNGIFFKYRIMGRYRQPFRMGIQKQVH